MTSPQESSPPPPPHREVTLAAVVTGLVVGAIMNASFTYAALKIGFGIGGSTVAAIIGFGVLRGVMRKGTILETNICQTVASAVNIPNAGIVFTVPVLFMLEYDLSLQGRDFWLICFAGVVGSILGCAFIIPLRKQMIEIDRLRFPTGTAVAEILKSPGAGAAKSRALFCGCLIGVAFALPAKLPEITVTVAEQTGPQEEFFQELEDKILVDDEEADEEGGKEAEPKEKKPKKNPIWGGYKSFGWTVPAEAPPLKPDRPESKDESAVDAYERQLIAYKAALDVYNKKLIEDGLDRDRDGQPDYIMSKEAIDVGRWFGLPPEILLLFALSPLSLGAGYITGRPGLMVLAGGLLAYFVLNPIAFNYLELIPAGTAAWDVPDIGVKQFNRPIGIGMLVGGAMMGVLFALPAMKAALKSIAGSRGSAGGSEELGLKPLGFAIFAGLIGLFLATVLVGGSENDTTGLLSGLPPVFRGLVIAIFGGLWIWFAGIIIAQCTGMTDWSPISGIALLTVVLVLMLGGKQNVVGAVMLGAALCVSVSCAADMVQDLKTGHLVGSIPRKQQKIELAVTGLGPIITMLVILVIVGANLRDPENVKKIPIGKGTQTEAPQSEALKAVIQGVGGLSAKEAEEQRLAEADSNEPTGKEMPYTLYGLGAALGGLLGLGGFPGLGVLVGLSMYLPIFYILTYGVGCVIYMIVARVKGKVWAEEWGVPLCAGLIVGEAVTSIVVSSIVVLSG